MTLRRIVYQIIEDLERYGITDDSVLDYELMKDKVIAFNQSLMKDYIQSQETSLEPFFQTIDCIDIECHHDTCNIGGITFVDPTTYYLVSFPVLFKTIGFKNIRYFGVEGFDKRISRVSMDGFLRSNGSKWTRHNAIYTVIGNTAILKNVPSGMAKGKLVALLDNPTTACNWPEDDEAEFPTPSVFKLMLVVKKDVGWLPAPDMQHDAQRAISQQQPSQRQSRDNQEE